MSIRTLIMVFLALVFGLAAAMGVSTILSSRAVATPEQTVAVVTAAVAIPRGGMLTAEQVKTVKYPPHLTPPGAISKVEDALDRGVLTPLVVGEPVLEGKLAAKGAGRGLAALVPKEMRAFTIHTPSVASGVAGFVMPGDHVDVLLTMSGDANDGTGGGSTITLLQNIEVMAVDQTIEPPSQNKVDANLLRSVTLQVTPDESLKLELGQNRGTLHLSLRNPGDKGDANTRIATLNGLRFKQEPPKEVEPTPPPPPAPAIVEAPKPPGPKPIYIYRSAFARIIEHQNDGSSARKVITEGTSAMGIPSQDEFQPTGAFR
jgi:pilus assembly protein CpaB